MVEFLGYGLPPVVRMGFTLPSVAPNILGVPLLRTHEAGTMRTTSKARNCLVLLPLSPQITVVGFRALHCGAMKPVSGLP